uniref:Uncharacterized protein n=1 Tax=Glossina austeni TaxID=7395 RepID=A0A1A9ULJ1_GLOAU
MKGLVSLLCGDSFLICFPPSDEYRRARLSGPGGEYQNECNDNAPVRPFHFFGHAFRGDPGWELNAIKPPKAKPNEKKICVPASSQTTGSSKVSQRGVNKCATPSAAPMK